MYLQDQTCASVQVFPLLYSNVLWILVDEKQKRVNQEI